MKKSTKKLLLYGGIAVALWYFAKKKGLLAGLGQNETPEYDAVTEIMPGTQPANPPPPDTPSNVLQDFDNAVNSVGAGLLSLFGGD